ncbi:hypothetical protein XM38_025530 [Halomicronema hongdechloris C2206]|uniref:Uncharacterized protein n=1 Tax=Halomicronema hongdechloris C2206 TaxID=1641165 RepID=A0A1Z3HMT2_9CYAN|nr:hypothetical protein [Halomicronema hongdechloris]ASC71600.1 hypothetical protein XM38_025530 [Halomicronema hongdechloris C2206]
MNTPSPSESTPNPQHQDDVLAMLQEQQQALKSNLEELQGRTNRLRGLVQTLVSGLVIAVLLAIGISGWFAYRLLVQEQIVQRETEQAAEANAAMLEQLETMETELQRQQEQLQTLREDVPEELTSLTDTVQSNQRRLELLQDQIQQLETATPAEGDN